MKPGSDEWNKLVTASKVAAILGVSPWESPYSMWRKMRGEAEQQPQTTAMSRGHYLEPAILAWWRDQHPEFADDTEVTHPTYTLEDWAAATPELGIMLTRDIDFHAPPICVVEAKSTNQLDEWGDPGTDVIPAYYLVQVYWQMHLSGAPTCFVPVIGPFLEFSEYVVEYDPAIGADLEARCRAFYESLSADEPPALDGSTATYNVVRKMHADIDKGVAVELTADEARQYVDARNQLKAAQEADRLAQSTVLERMQRAQYAECLGQRIARRQPNKYGVQLNQVAKTITATTEDAA